MCAVAFGFAFVLLGVRLSSISFGGAEAASVASFAHQADEFRPDIVDRNGALLAVNVPVVALEVAGAEVWSAADTAAALARTIGDIDEEALRKKLEAGAYVEVARDLTPAQKTAVFDLGLPGVHFQPRVKRYYPQHDLAAHVIGRTEPGKGGVSGLEAYADERGREQPLAASIDVRAQRAIELELAAAIDRFKAKAAWGAVMDVKTGEVVALASLPDFDPNYPARVEADWRRNRVTYDRYELGSIFKAISAASALEAGVAEEKTVYDARGGYRLADWTIRDFHGENRLLTLSEVVQYSSNIGAARMAADMGVETQKAFLRSLGLFDRLPIELNENRAPQLPQKWGPVEAATVAYGHGISVTPLHLLAAFGALVNDGVYYRPTFEKQETSPVGETVFSKDTSLVMRRVLRRVITNGTAQYADAPGYHTIGKTGSADKPFRGGYKKDALIASFVGAFPGHDPRYAVLVSLDEPQAVEGTYGYATAGWNAAPTFARIVERIAPVLGVMPASESEALAAFFDDTPARQSSEAPDRRRREKHAGEKSARSQFEVDQNAFDRGAVGGAL
ncbi:MAG: penicillin-binding protein 2 [Pseudomonadota bacterium]